MTSRFPALSIRQPWAELILRGEKTIELRTWSTGYRGKLWLHTGQRGSFDVDRGLSHSNLFKGGYIGSIVVAAVVPVDPIRWQLWQEKHLNSGPYHPGMFALVLTSPLRFKEPISGKGRLKLFPPHLK